MTTRIMHSKFEREVLARLQQLGLTVESGYHIGGYEPDFVVSTADGRKFVVEVKGGWLGDPSHVERAKRQVALYQHALGADGGFVIMPSLHAGSSPDKGVLSINDLDRLPFLMGAPAQGQIRESASQPVVADEKERMVFAAMPFAPAFDDVFFVAMAHAAKEIGAVCKRIDREDFSGDIVEEIKRLIQSSIAVIADLSGARPNVLYELGYAQGVHRPTIHITSTPADELPFDVRNWSVLSYTVGQTHKLREPLKKRLQAVLARG